MLEVLTSAIMTVSALEIDIAKQVVGAQDKVTVHQHQHQQSQQSQNQNH